VYIFQWALSMVFFVVAAFVTMANCVMLRNQIVHQKNQSLVPLIAGVSAALGILTLPVEGLRPWWWVALVADVAAFVVLFATMALLYRAGPR
jgi:hypothetical protein